MNDDSFADVALVEPNGDVVQVVKAIRLMASTYAAWEIMEAESKKYSHGIGSAGLILSIHAGEKNSTLAVAERNGSSTGTMYVANIIPQSGRFSAAEYNAIAARFTSDFRMISRNYRLGIKCSLSIRKWPTTLETMISGKQTRALFQRFIFIGEAFQFAPIVHPLDIERLDAFICAIHRYRASVHWPALRHWLISELDWNERDADWLVQRACIGLEILRANGRF